MYSTNISQCQTEEHDDNDSAQRNLENFSDDSNGPLSTSSKNQTIQKNLQPLKIKIPINLNLPSVKKRNQCVKQRAKKKKIRK